MNKTNNQFEEPLFFKDKPIMLVGFDVHNFVKKLCNQFLGEHPYMTEGEKKAHKLGINNVLSLLDQTLNEMTVDEDKIYHNIVVHVSGVETMTEFLTIEDILDELEKKENK